MWLLRIVCSIFWLAAITFLSLSNFEDKVIEKADQAYLKVFKRDYAHRIHDFLYGKIPEYFYGADDEIGLDEALKKSRPNCAICRRA